MTAPWLALALAAAALAAPAPRRLAVVGPALHQYEDGPAVPASYSYAAGDTVFLSFRISGYQPSEKDQVRLGYQVEALDPKGLPLAPPSTGKVDAELADEDKDWMPKARFSVLVPPSAASGAYRIRIQVKDELGGADASGEISFAVRGHPVEPSDTLVLRNFRFLRGEEDGPPLPVAAYRPGDTLWARFEITGYKLGEKNRYQVEYGISVLRPSGEVLYTQPSAASEKDETFYPTRYVLGALSLNLDANLAKGEYVLMVTAKDLIGNQTAQTRRPFRVE